MCGDKVMPKCSPFPWIDWLTPKWLKLFLLSLSWHFIIGTQNFVIQTFCVLNRSQHNFAIKRFRGNLKFWTYKSIHNFTFSLSDCPRFSGLKLRLKAEDRLEIEDDLSLSFSLLLPLLNSVIPSHIIVFLTPQTSHFHHSISSNKRSERVPSMLLWWTPVRVSWKCVAETRTGVFLCCPPICSVPWSSPPAVLCADEGTSLFLAALCARSGTRRNDRGAVDSARAAIQFAEWVFDSRHHRTCSAKMEKN